MIPLAFYAPLKSPNDPVPSGDRTMARLLMRALRLGGFEPELTSDLRSLDIRGDDALQADLAGRAEAETDRLIAAYRSRAPERCPRLWFTYHCYYKAPDLLGPRVAKALSIPYAIAEGSRAPKRAHGPWAAWHAAAETALGSATRLFVMAPQDREALEQARSPRQTIIDLPPFLDAEIWRETKSPASPSPREAAGRAESLRRSEPGWGASTRIPGVPVGGTAPHPARAPRESALPAAARGEGWREPPRAPLRLLTVAMMRPGDKLASYRLLAEALAALGDGAGWTLDIVGGGVAQSQVEAAFAAFGPRVRFHGAIAEPTQLAALYREADLFVWPAVNEAYGMVFLEAQAAGCPVLAGREGGVPAVLRDGETGFLVDPREATAFAGRLRDLIARPAALAPMREAARRFVGEHRDLGRAAAILRDALEPLARPAAPTEAA